MSKKFRLLMVLVLMTGLLGGLLTGSTVSADPIPGLRIQIPRIDKDDPLTGWSTKIQVQNVGTAPTWAAVVYWGAPGLCPPNENGSLAVWHYQRLPLNGIWTVIPPAGARSAIVWSFLDPWTPAKPTPATVATGEPLAVTVDRWGPDPAMAPLEISSSYVGISESMEGPPPPLGWKYFAPYVMDGYVGALDTVITIQNSGVNCTSVWIWYKEQGNCEYQVTQHILDLAPGEAIRVGSSAAVAALWADVAWPLTAPWLGSAYISANEPLGIIVDQLSLNIRAVLLTYRALPYKQLYQYDWYADLLYREISGWDASIQVQNLTQESKNTFVCVDFMDQSGDEILFVCDWVCRNGAVTFYLPAITDLGVNHPFGYVGAAEIASLQQVDYPGGHEYGEPIFALVDIKKRKMVDPITGLVRPTVAGENQGGAYNAHPRIEKEWAWAWFMPFIAKQGNGVTSRIALRNNSNCNKFYGKIWVFDETGTAVGVVHTPWLMPKHLKIIDLAYQGFLYPGFVGAAKFVVEGVEQLCDVDNDGHVDNEPIMPSIVVMNYGWEAELGIDPPATDMGDLTRIYEAIPGGYAVKPCYADLMGKVHNIDPCENGVFDNAMPVEGAMVTVSGVYTGTADSTGDYEVEDLVYGVELPVSFVKSGFLTYDTTVDVDCGEDEVLDAELLCLGDVQITVLTSVATDTLASVINGAAISYSKPLPAKAGHYGATYTVTGTTNAAGQATLTVPIINATGEFDISAPGIAETGQFDWVQMLNGPDAAQDPDLVNDTVGRAAADVTAGAANNTKVLSGTIGVITIADLFDTGAWYGFDEDSCANIGGAIVSLPNTDIELVLCGFGTVAGRVTVGGIQKADELVEVIMGGVVVGSGVTDMWGNYVIQGIATDCFDTCDAFQVLCNGWLQSGFTWDGCGDVERVDFAF